MHRPRLARRRRDFQASWEKKPGALMNESARRHGNQSFSVFRTDEEVGDALGQCRFGNRMRVLGAEFAFGAGLGDEGILGFFAELLELDLFVLSRQFPLIDLAGELVDFEVVAGGGGGGGGRRGGSRRGPGGGRGASAGGGRGGGSCGVSGSGAIWEGAI